MPPPQPGHNRPPLSMAEAQAQADVRLRPSYLQRFTGYDAPLRAIVGTAELGPIGRWVLLECGHWREIRDYDLLFVIKRRPKPRRSRCGCCLHGYRPEPADLAEVARLKAAP